MLTPPRHAAPIEEREIMRDSYLMRQVSSGMSALRDGSFFGRLLSDEEVRGK